MERRAGLKPTSYLGKRYVINTKLSPHKKNMERRPGFKPESLFRKKSVMNTKLPPHIKAPTGLEPVIEDLQSSALPLG